VWDVTPFDAGWVLLPGLLALAVAGLLLALRARAREVPRRRLLGPAAVLLALGAVWWTLGGIGAWRAGMGRVATGTADFVEGTVAAPERGPSDRIEGFQVGGVRFHRAPDAFAPALHATRWPTVPLREGERVRVWSFGDDVLRLEAAEPR
jgi:hypothetical protein